MVTMAASVKTVTTTVTVGGQTTTTTTTTTTTAEAAQVGPASSRQPEVYLLDYGGGNVRSVINAIKAAGCTSLKLIESVEDFDKVGVRGVFPCHTRCNCMIEN